MLPSETSVSIQRIKLIQQMRKKSPKLGAVGEYMYSTFNSSPIALRLLPATTEVQCSINKFNLASAHLLLVDYCVQGEHL